MPSYMAGVEGFEPPNGGIKTCHMDQDNQQVAETTDRRVPSSPFDSPSLPPDLPPAIGETAVVLGAARGTTNYLLLSANLRRPTGPCHVTPIRPQAHQRVAWADPKESRKVALRTIDNTGVVGAAACECQHWHANSFPRLRFIRSRTQGSNCPSTPTESEIVHDRAVGSAYSCMIWSSNAREALYDSTR
jgi:hypothetical protein